jgi:hypothetical protein
MRDSKFKERIVNWSEIKKATEAAGIRDDDELSSIQCDLNLGNKTFHVVRLGRFVRLVEDLSSEAQKEAVGCTC